MRIVFLGPPGVGKGTQAVELAKQLGIVHLSTGEMLRQAAAARSPVGLQTQEFLAAGKLVPDDVMLDLVRQRLKQEDCRGGYVLDGFPRTIVQAQALDAMLKQENAPLSAVIDIQADVAELVRRLLARGRADDQPAVIQDRLEQYTRQTAPLSDYYSQQGLLHTIDGRGSRQDVFERILGAIDSVAHK
ncbi:MAG: adenylate kinase [Pirellulales bacterium]